MQNRFPELRVLGHGRNRGKGHALRTGIAVSRGRRVMFADAGSCVPYEDALRGLALVEEGVPLAHGSRRHAGARVEVAPGRFGAPGAGCSAGSATSSWRSPSAA